jgi:GGDEF domain-containing protein
MTESQPSPLVGRTVTALVLLAGGLIALATSIVPASDGLRGAAVAVAAVGLTSVLLGVDAVRRHLPVALVASAACLAATAWSLRAIGGDVAVVATPAAGAGILLWASLSWGRGAAAKLAFPALLVSSATWVWHGGTVPAAPFAIVPLALLVGEAAAWPLAQGRRHRTMAKAALADVDTLLLAALDLRDVDDVATCGERIARIGTELLDGAGAVLYVQGPGRLLLAGKHGSHPEPLDSELGRDATVESVLHVGAVEVEADRALVPVVGATGVVGVLVIAEPHRRIDALTSGMAQLFGAHVGTVLDRLNAVDSLFDAATRDPITGVGNRQQAAAVIASLRPGDGFLVLEVDEFASLLRGQGEAASNLLLGQVGLHLRNGTRNGDAVARFSDSQFVIALRDLKAPIDMVVERLVATWLGQRPTRTLSVGGALHVDGEAPMDTVERAESALASAKRKGGGQGHVAPDWSVFVG